MSYTYDVLEGGHIIVVTLHSDFDMVREIQQMGLDGNKLVEQNPAPIVYITDARALHFTTLNDLLEAANAVRTVKPEERVNRHPKVIKSLAVISSRVMQVAAKGLNSVSFGHIDVTMFATLEEAMAQARELLREAGHDSLSAA